MVRAAFVGAGIAVVGAFLLTLLHGDFSTNAPFDDEVVYGAEGGINAVKLLILMAIATWPFLVAAVLGSVTGVAIHWRFRVLTPRQSTHRAAAPKYSSFEETICPVLLDGENRLRSRSSKPIFRFLADVGIPLARGSERPANDRPA